MLASQLAYDYGKIEKKVSSVWLKYHSVARQCYTVVRATQQVNGK